MQDFGISSYLSITKLAPPADAQFISVSVTFLRAILVLFEEISVSVLVLFAILLATASELFYVLRIQLKRTAPNELEMENYRRYHAPVCRFITKINHSFGLVLLIAISSGIVSFILGTFEIVIKFSDDNNSVKEQISAMLNFTKYFLRLTVITIGPCRIQHQVTISFTFIII